MMAKMIKKTMAMVLALCICFSALPLQALAAEDGTVEKTKDGVTTTVTTQTETTKDPATGDTTVTVTIQKDTEGTKTSTGVKVEGSETKVTTTVTDEDGKKTTTKVEDGYEKTETEIPNSVEDVTVEISTKTDNPATEENEGQNVGTTPVDPTKEPEIKGDKPKGEDDKKYNYTETYEKPGTVTVTTEKVEITEKVDVEGTDLDYVRNEVTPDSTNDLIKQNVATAPEEFLPGSDVENPVIPEDVNEDQAKYDYVYVGTGNTSQFRPTPVFTEPMDEDMKLELYGDHYKHGAYIHSKYHTGTFVGWLNEEAKSKVVKNADGTYPTDEEGFILDVDGNRVMKEEKVAIGPDGEKYYLHRFDAISPSVEGWYEDGEWVKDLNGKDVYTAVWSDPTQFVLVDKETGEVITTYCADLQTKTQKHYGYNIENLEDADYYSEEEAKRIRTIALNGYWGTLGTETDENGNTVPKKGSLAAMKAQLLASGKFTQEELESLTDGVALSATQMAIWSCSNKMAGTKFVNAHYLDQPENTETDISDGNGNHNIPTDKEDETTLMFRIYEYLIALAPTELKGTTRDTLINADNFVEGMEVTVVKKAKGHENNKDKDKNNDAYVTNLTFALVVEVDEKNGDNLKVSVVDSNGNPILNEKGKPVVGRIAGALEEGEIQLVNNNGNYCFENIVLTEGANTFKLNLEGIQNLQEGVYLYSSDVVEEVSSQTMVGIASGKRGVSVSMDLKFELDVKDKVVVKERVWHSEKTNDNTTPPPGGNVPPNNPPEEPQLFNMNREDGVVIIDEQVPLAAAPKTGDNSFLFIALALFAAISLCAANFDKKRKHEAF